MSRLTRDGTAEPVSRDQTLRHARGQGNVHFPCSADHEQDWQPYPVDPYSAICDDHTYIHTYRYIHRAACLFPVILRNGDEDCHRVLYCTVLLLSLAKAVSSARTCSCPAHLPTAEAGHRVVSSCDDVSQKS